MSEEKFFGNVRETLYTYAPEVPADVYGRMRRRLWLSQFLQFSAGRLNVWYILFAGVLTAGGLMMFSGDSSQALRSGAYESGIPELHFAAGTSQPCETAPVCVNAPRACIGGTTDANQSEELTEFSPITETVVAETGAPEEIAAPVVSEEVQNVQEPAPAQAPVSTEAPKKGKGLSPKILRDKNR